MSLKKIKYGFDKFKSIFLNKKKKKTVALVKITIEIVKLQIKHRKPGFS